MLEYTGTRFEPTSRTVAPGISTMSRRASIHLSLCLAALAAVASPASGEEPQLVTNSFVATEPMPSQATAVATTTDEPTPPEDPPFTPDVSYMPQVGDWVILKPKTKLRSSAGRLPASPSPTTYMINQLKDVGTTKWCWVVSDAAGWVTTDEIVPPIETFKSINDVIESSTDH